MEIFKPENVPEVIQLQVGYCTYPGNGLMVASSSCTLIKANKIIVVDTMTPFEKQQLIDSLQEHGVRCEDVDYVINTHYHPDHTGNNNLFLNAVHIIGCYAVGKGPTWFMDKDISKKDYELCPFVRVTHNPGHTPEDVSVIVQVPDIDKSLAKNQFIGKVYAVTGDMFFEEADIEQPQIWTTHFLDNGIPGAFKGLHDNRKRTASFADYIIPGHGPMFAVTADLKKIILSQDFSYIEKFPHFEGLVAKACK